MEIKENNRELTSYFQANSGAEAKSNVPFKAQYLQSVVGDSQFEQYRQEIGFFHKEIIEDWVLPDALEAIANETEMFASFSPQELALIDETIVNAEVIEARVRAIIGGKQLNAEEVELMTQGIKRDVRKNGSKRTITDIQEFIKDVGKSVRIHTTDEARNKAVLFESYSNLLQVISPEDPRFAAILDKVMQALGINKEDLELYNDEALMGQNGQITDKEQKQQDQPQAQAAMSQLA
jgi:hypothetical protein